MNSAVRPPSRSSITPPGIAAKMYTSCQVPMMLPIAAWLIPSSRSMGTTSGAIAVAVSPKAV